VTLKELVRTQVSKYTFECKVITVVKMVSYSTITSNIQSFKMKTAWLHSIVVALTVTSMISVPFVNGDEDFCVMDTIKSNSTSLQFTKELSSREYVVAQKFKSLHCCTKGYRSIEW
jgi:hypothetical protein